MRKRDIRALEQRLRDERPKPSNELVARFAPVRRARTRTQLALAGGLTAVMLVGLSAVGGVSYAANSISHVAHVAKGIVSPSKGHQSIAIQGMSAGHDQYKPGYGYGDKNHTHTGPPGVKPEGGKFAPPLTARKQDSYARVVSTSFTLDEQAHLYISVVDGSGKQVLLTQKSVRGSSSFGAGLNGPQAKVIQYLVLVPRTMPLALRIPANLLVPGQMYRIRISAVDAEGNKTTSYIRFRG